MRLGKQLLREVHKHLAEEQVHYEAHRFSVRRFLSSRQDTDSFVVCVIRHD